MLAARVQRDARDRLFFPAPCSPSTECRRRTPASVRAACACDRPAACFAQFARAVVGLTIIPGAAGGIFFGGACVPPVAAAAAAATDARARTHISGWFVKKLQLNGINTAKMAWMVALACLGVLVGFYMGCGTVQLAGVTHPYFGPPLRCHLALCAHHRRACTVDSSSPLIAGGQNGIINLNATCNGACVCDPDRYQPVCGDDGLNYFSACFGERPAPPPPGANGRIRPAD
jgi:hypothetical protein